MKNYKIYTSEYGDYIIVEIYNETDLLNIQYDLVSQGYIIAELIAGKFIKCMKWQRDFREEDH